MFLERWRVGFHEAGGKHLRPKEDIQKKKKKKGKVFAVIFRKTDRLAGEQIFLGLMLPLVVEVVNCCL